MALERSTLRPYKSFVLARIKDEFEEARFVDYALTDITEMLSLEGAARRRLVSRSPAQMEGELEIGFIHFTESRPAPWTEDPSIEDMVNHLVLVARRNRHVAICVTDGSLRSSIMRRFDRGETAGIGAFQAISAGLMNAAFVQGTTRTLWLSATHRRTTVKADSKILSGIDLRDALDPVADQSYYFTAARSGVDLEGVQGTVGSSPRGSKVWLGITEDWEDFKLAMRALLSRLEETRRPERSPLPIIAVDSIDVHKVQGAFDVALVPPEIAIDDPSIDGNARHLLERWSYGAHFELLERSGPSFTANLFLNGKAIGTMEFDVNVADPEHVRWRVSGEPVDEDTGDLLEEALTVCRNRDWLKTWYDSGHALSNGSLFEIRYRDMPFRGYEWHAFRDFNIVREKPDPLAEIGRQDSLFCWVRQSWPRGTQGWLACDDGAMEIADFIHLDDLVNPPVLSLIHVKAAGSAEQNRGISVSKYEVVTSQAVKNLRSLDRLILEEGLREGLAHKVGALVWHNHRASNRHDMLNALHQVGSDYARRVVILQPHLSRAKYEHAREHRRSRDAARLRQLDALLLVAEAGIHGLGASLSVIGER